VNLAVYYEDTRKLARKVRAEYGLCLPRVLRTDMRRIYSSYGIKVDLWPYKLRNLRGAFFNDELGPTVVLAKGLPPDPMVFTMAHELKHFLKDRDLLLSYCDQSNENRPIERGAEVFASEFLFPDEDFVRYLIELGVKRATCSERDLVRLKCETKTTLSYAGLAIKAERLGFAQKESVTQFKGWKRLEAELYGPPRYIRFGRQRQRRTAPTGKGKIVQGAERRCMEQ
jgi:hypothetical protein